MPAVFALWICQSDCTVPNKFGLRPDLWYHFSSKSEFLPRNKRRTERLLSLQKYMQIRSSNDYDRYTEVTHCLEDRCTDDPCF